MDVREVYAWCWLQKKRERRNGEWSAAGKLQAKAESTATGFVGRTPVWKLDAPALCPGVWDGGGGEEVWSGLSRRRRDQSELREYVYKSLDILFSRHHVLCPSIKTRRLVSTTNSPSTNHQPWSRHPFQNVMSRGFSHLEVARSWRLRERHPFSFSCQSSTCPGSC